MRNSKKELIRTSRKMLKNKPKKATVKESLAKLGEPAPMIDPGIPKQVAVPIEGQTEFVRKYYPQPIYFEVENTTYDKKRVSLFSRLIDIPEGVKVSAHDNWISEKAYEFFLIKLIREDYEYSSMEFECENPYQFENEIEKKYISINGLTTCPINLLSFISENHLSEKKVWANHSGKLSYNSEINFDIEPRTKLRINFCPEYTADKPDKTPFHRTLFVKNHSDETKTFSYNGSEASLEKVFNDFEIKAMNSSSSKSNKIHFVDLFKKDYFVDRIWAPTSINHSFYFQINKNGYNDNTFVTEGFAKEKCPNQFLHIMKDRGYSNDKKIIKISDGEEFKFVLGPNEYVILLLKELSKENEKNSNSFQ